MDVIEEARAILHKYEQEKMLKILNKLDEREKQKLAKEILETNFDEILELYKSEDKEESLAENIEQIESIDEEKMSKAQKEAFSKIGENIIKNNQYAVVTMAGGQGTRLGCNGPKGTFKLDIGEKGKYIFEILVDTLNRAKEKYEVEVYWYIMTSIENNYKTVKFMEDNNYFGYNKEKVKFFNQKELPIVDMEGNLLVSKDFHIKKASDGNGAVYKSLKESHMLEDMKEKGIKWVCICGVDNIMVNMVDSILIGLAINKNAQSASKSVKKLYPEERVGIFCKKNGKPAIIEYIEMNEQMIYAKKSDGELLYNESNIVNHLFNIDYLEKIATHKLKYHKECKKNSYIDEDLNEFIPKEPNTYKFESFIFDGFEYLDNMIIMSVDRNKEFAPVKNREGVDSPETAIKIYKDNFSK